MSGEKKLMRKKGKESTREKDKKAKIKSFNGKRKKIGFREKMLLCRMKMLASNFHFSFFKKSFFYVKKKNIGTYLLPSFL